MVQVDSFTGCAEAMNSQRQLTKMSMRVLAMREKLEEKVVEKLCKT